MTKTIKLELKSVVHFFNFCRIVPIKITLKYIVPELLILDNGNLKKINYHVSWLKLPC